MQSTIETRRTRDYERYEANRRFEEMTDIAERIGYPIDTVIRYEMREGAAYCMSDTRERPFHAQTWLALQQGAGRFVGDSAFEAERLRLEHEEALLVDAFGRGEVEGNILVKISKVPDAVVRGETSIKGYRRDLLRSFVRVYHRTDSGVECRLFTLDRNSQAGLARVGEVLDIDATAPSEHVLAAVSTFTVPKAGLFVDGLVERVKLAYDDARFAETGERSYAGSTFLDKQNAMEEILNQSLLVDRHMQAITEIMQAGRGEAALEHERKSTAAAIKLASQGIVVDSNGHSSVAAEVESGNYDRECATASEAVQNGMNQAQRTMENIWQYGECQVCFAKTLVGSCYVCASCAAADDRGVDLLKLREYNLRSRVRNQNLARTSLRSEEYVTLPQPRPTVTTKQQLGPNIRVRQRITVGNAVTELYDWQTNEVVATR